MSHNPYSLLTLREDMRQGKGDALPGTSMFNEADGYWLPLQEVLTMSLETSRLHAM